MATPPVDTHELECLNSDTKRPDTADIDIDGIEEESDIRGDRGNLALLIFLYLLQGIPLGLTSCVPMVLQQSGASYQTQAAFSIVHWPFNLKLLWAPIIDSLYSQRFGRRKSWLVPVQLLIGLFMLWVSCFIDGWLRPEHLVENMPVLGVAFFTMTMLACTQDIIVDGWALTLLKRRNIGYASVCNNIGNPLGYFLGYALLISLQSPEFCNKYLRSVPQDDVGILTMSGYIRFWGVCFLLTTLLIAIFKKETDYQAPAEKRPTNIRGHLTNVWKAYKAAFDILRIPAVKTLALVLLTVRALWADFDGVNYLKILNSGVDQSKMIPLMAFSSIPVQFCMSLVAARFTTGTRPAKCFMIGIPVRTLFSLCGAAILWFMPMILAHYHGVAPNYIYLVYLLNKTLYMLNSFGMHIVLTAFFIRVSDPTIGGTYMTMLHTIDQVGYTWPHTLALWMVESLTWRDCSMATGTTDCPIVFDGYFVETGICLVYGLIWYKWGITTLRRLYQMPVSKWRVMDNDTRG